MEFKQHEITDVEGIKITIEEGSKVVGRVRLYVLHNDLHQQPFGFLEDLFVEEECRSKGYGRKLVEEAAAEARKQGCYKLVCTSRSERENLHEWYRRLGFKKYGVELRMDLQ